MTLSVNLDERHEALVAEKIASGEYGDASAVVSEALDALAMRDGEGLQELRRLIDEGDASGIYEGDVFSDLRKKYGLPSV